MFFNWPHMGDDIEVNYGDCFYLTTCAEHSHIMLLHLKYSFFSFGERQELNRNISTILPTGAEPTGRLVRKGNDDKK